MSSRTTATVLSRKDGKREDKLRKAEEKKRKKEEARYRMEMLALELKERERQKASAADRQSTHSGRSHGRGRRQWDEEVAMYDGLVAL